MVLSCSANAMEGICSNKGDNHLICERQTKKRRDDGDDGEERAEIKPKAKASSSSSSSPGICTSCCSRLRSLLCCSRRKKVEDFVMFDDDVTSMESPLIFHTAAGESPFEGGYERVRTGQERDLAEGVARGQAWVDPGMEEDMEDYD